MDAIDIGQPLMYCAGQFTYLYEPLSVEYTCGCHSKSEALPPRNILFFHRVVDMAMI